VLTALGILWEVSLALCLTFKGFRPSPITAGVAEPRVAG
jgi:hypothetical protein